MISRLPDFKCLARRFWLVHDRGRSCGLGIPFLHCLSSRVNHGSLCRFRDLVQHDLKHFGLSDTGGKGGWVYDTGLGECQWLSTTVSLAQESTQRIAFPWSPRRMSIAILRNCSYHSMLVMSFPRVGTLILVKSAYHRPTGCGRRSQRERWATALDMSQIPSNLIHDKPCKSSILIDHPTRATQTFFSALCNCSNSHGQWLGIFLPVQDEPGRFKGDDDAVTLDWYRNYSQSPNIESHGLFQQCETPTIMPMQMARPGETTEGASRHSE